MHLVDVAERDYVELIIDHKHMGLGGDDYCRARPHTPYLIYPKRYEYSFEINLFEKYSQLNSK